MGAGSASYTESMCRSEQIPKCLGPGPPSGSQSLGGGSHNCNLQKEGIQRVLSLLDDRGVISQAADLGVLHRGSGISFVQFFLRASCILSIELGPLG